ncbi:MAG: FAD-binding oxidoreductase [Chloroflexi bacterium]|nr:FAD-binding oxidoreductase [Chloroflexota bacterium]
MTTAPDAPAIDELQGTFAGQLLRPEDEGYEEARQIQNGMIDKRPALIARCLGVADIVDAVNFARDKGLELSVRGGGHNIGGKALTDGGVMIDLSWMRGVQVDPAARTARAHGGAIWGEFNRETQIHGLATTGGVVSSTGVAGLTLGGGLGWLMGKYGMAVDNLIAAEVVTADGSVVRASESENADLLWGLRGGGGNFGVAASLEYRLHEVGPTVTSGLIAHPADQAKRVLGFYRELTSSLPDELTVFCALLHAPDGSGVPLAAMILCHCGPMDEGERAVRPIKEFGSPVLDVVGPMSYDATNRMLDAGSPKGALNYWKSSYLDELSDGAIDTLIEQFSTVPSQTTLMLIEHIHGAATRVGETDTAFPHRSEGYNALFASQWQDPSETERNVAWTRETYSALEPYMAAGRYVNYLGEDEGEDPVAAAYGPNYDRLRELKAKYDPDNLFRMNQNVRPK